MILVETVAGGLIVASVVGLITLAITSPNRFQRINGPLQVVGLAISMFWLGIQAGWVMATREMVTKARIEHDVFIFGETPIWVFAGPFVFWISFQGFIWLCHNLPAILGRDDQD